MVENPCERSVGAGGGNQAVRKRGGNKSREREAGRSLRNAAFRAEPKKLCINTTFSINDKTVYKHVFFHVAQHRPKTKPCINTVFLSVDAVLHGKNNVYTLFFSLRIKVVFIHCFFGSARNATLLKLAGALPHVLPPVPTCDSGGSIVCADSRRMWHDMAAKTQI